MKHRLLWLFAVALLISACGTDQTETNTSAGPTGRIRGKVTLIGNLPAPETEPINQDQATCGNTASLPRLALGDSKGVQNAFVFLDGVKPVGTMKPRGSVLVDQKDCHYA